MDPLGDIIGTSAGPKRSKSKILTVEKHTVLKIIIDILKTLSKLKRINHLDYFLFNNCYTVP